MEEQITNVCSSIFIHNLDLDNVYWDFNNSPLATLLKISDELQSWGRPSNEKPKGEPADDFDIGFYNGKINFYVKDDLVECYKAKMKKIVNFPITIEDF